MALETHNTKEQSSLDRKPKKTVNEDEERLG
jgi:hypothetical protein